MVPFDPLNTGGIEMQSRLFPLAGNIPKIDLILSASASTFWLQAFRMQVQSVCLFGR
jgi:hypothetical protein